MFFTILIPTKYINSHYKCFGHFVTDHIFMLFKFKNYFEENDVKIEGINILCYQKLIRKFMNDFYKLIFNDVKYNSKIEKSNNINLGIILGSLENTEKERIYLAKSSLKNDLIPDYLYENCRKISENNKFYMNLFREYIWNKLELKKNKDKKIDFLIINRKSNGRKWLNLNFFIKKINKKKKIKVKTVNMEDYILNEQIELIYNSKNILFPSGSSQGHLFWVDKETTCIECFIPGHRYINTILYSISLDINTILLFDKFIINKDIKEKLPEKFKKLLDYQENAEQILCSKDINNKQINNEKEWFELFLDPLLSNYYLRQCKEDIDLNLKINRILKII